MNSTSVNRPDDKAGGERKVARRESGQSREKFKKVMDTTSKNPQEGETGGIIGKKTLPKPFEEVISEVDSSLKKEEKELSDAPPVDIFNIAARPVKEEASPKVAVSHEKVEVAAVTPGISKQEKIAPISMGPKEELPLIDKESIEKATASISITPALQNTQASVFVENIPAPVRIQNLKELAQTMLKTMMTLNRKGETETIVTLHNSTLFDGATIRLTQTTSAPKEFNITFGNLSTDAMRLMQARQTQEGLQHVLAERGYTVHMIVVRHDADEAVSYYRDQTGEQRREREQPQEEDEG